MKQDVKKLFGIPPSIVLVEDDDGDAKALTRAFAKAGVKNQIIRVWDGAEALDFLRGENSTPPACYVVLLDINMPRMSGHEFIRELRKDPLLRASTVFVMSTSNDWRDKIAAYRGNVAGYILKTKNRDDLMNVVELLERYLRVVQLPDLSIVE